ncbi:hypothetical protein EMPS_03292 [Entomortierella parvispora]|uniref:YMC020W-like alpha/beta hydrolase domain-containing protein n=1 Tax=Entomortierella parvispora TaxID=205924 RepID=A0A9P3LUG0_9FUNG|nr:hypothetical protein EMPS_03292 [Entomortierella parvispora]
MSSSGPGSSWTSSLKGGLRSLLPTRLGGGGADDQGVVAVEEVDPSMHQVTDYREGERHDVHGNRVRFQRTESHSSSEMQQQQQDTQARAQLPLSSSATAPIPPQTQTMADPKQNKKDSGTALSRAVASLSKAVVNHDNVVLPDYYEQFPDVLPSVVLTVPVGPQEIAVSRSNPLIVAPSSLPWKIWRGAVDGLKGLFFSQAPAGSGSSEPGKDNGVARGTQGIQKVVIIGIHGWYPRKALRTVIGEPTGTSKKFCEEMDLALKEYLEKHGKSLDPKDVTLIPLEGEGKVLERVDLLYRQLVRNMEWRQAVQDADLVLVATHSQGTPTSVLVVAQLIKDGLLRVREDDPNKQRIGMLTMAGISHGPFPFLKGNLIVRWFEAEAAGELFEFMDSNSHIAQKYRDGLRIVLSSGVRLTCVASLEDQVVPLYSAVMTSIHHPSIVRAVYVDGASYQNDFLINLIAFSLRLRNAGVDDHGILVHLSEVIAGSLYGEGHSTIYEEREVYMLSIRSLLEPPSSLTPAKARSEPILHPFRAKQRLNPFYLPWGMRGVADEILARGDQILIKELGRLQKLYSEWNPVSKGMKEIKFRLEPVRSKL